LPATDPPIGAQQKVIAEDPILGILESPPADQTEISHEFFPFSGIRPIPGGASAAFPSYRIGVRSKGHALPKAAITGAKNGPKDATTRRFRSPENRAHTIAVTEITRGLSKADYVGSLPMHFSLSFWRPASAASAGTCVWFLISNLSPHRKPSRFIPIYLLKISVLVGLPYC